MVTRKTTQGMFLMRPSAKVRNCIRYCIALAQKRSKVRIHSIVFLSNHYHIVLTDTLGNVPVFTEELNKLIARAFNCMLGRRENFWSGGDQTSQVVLAEASDVFAKTLYLLVNPTQAGLVSRGEDWPGVRLFKKGKYISKKPKFFFRSMADGGKLPQKAYVELTPPPIDAQPQVCDEVVERAVRAKEKQIRLAFKLAGKTFMGAAKIMKQDIYASPKRPAPMFNLSPQVACRDKWRRVEILQQLVEFARDHKEKREKFVAGVRDVVFPAGTYKMARQFGACCEKL